MDIMSVFYVVVYFTIGWFMSDWIIEDEKNREELMMFIFLFWPLLIILLGLMAVICVGFLVSAFISKLLGSFKGGDSDVSV